MRLLFAALLVGHGLIHLLGAAKGFGVAELPQLTRYIAIPMGLLWFIAALVNLAAALSLYTWPRIWWIIAGCAGAVSQLAILSYWTDAKWGSVANLVIMLAALYGYCSLGPTSFQAEFDLAVEEAMRNTSNGLAPPEDFRARLPGVVQKYLETTHTTSRPDIANLRARLNGEIRSGPTEAWMKFTAEQFNTFGADPSRIFLMKASRAGIPFEALHIYKEGTASMRVKIASIWTVADAKGSEMDKAETVTVLNDMCLMAPSALANEDIVWKEKSERAVRAIFSTHGRRIAAELTFEPSGELTNFESADRFRSSADGKAFQQMWWSSPVSRYRDFGEARLWSKGEARWHPPEGEFAYGRFELLSIEYDLGRAKEAASKKTATAAARLGARGAK